MQSRPCLPLLLACLLVEPRDKKACELTWAGATSWTFIGVPEAKSLDKITSTSNLLTIQELHVDSHSFDSGTRSRYKSPSTEGCSGAADAC